MQKTIIYLSVALFIISCDQVTAPVIVNKSNKSSLAVEEPGNEIKKAIERTDRIILLQNIRDSLPITRELPDSTKRKYSVRLKNKIDIYGFYDYTSSADVQNDKLGYLNTFIYNSLFIRSKTGEIIDINGWKNADIITAARKNGCDVGVTFAFKEPDEAVLFLQNNSSQSYFIKESIELMKFRSGKAINISFKNIPPEINYNFFNFCKRLYDTLKKPDNSYKLLITIPATTSGNYPLSELSKISDRVIIDFSEKYTLKASPLASLTDLNNVLAYFVNSGVLKEKIVICLPYRGTKWKVNAGKKDEFIKYIKYRDLRSIYFQTPTYISYYPDTLSSFAVMDSFRIVGRDKSLLRRIYYDDASTISKKYEFILNQGFNGVAVNGLGDDFGYTALWDAMSYAFAAPDTVYADSTKQMKARPGLSSFNNQHRIPKMSNLLVPNVVVLQKNIK